MDNTQAIYIDLNKDQRASLVLDPTSAQTLNEFPSLTVGRVYPMLLVFTDNGSTSSLNGNAGVTIRVSVGGNGYSQLAYQPNWGYIPNVGYTSSLSTATTEGTTALGTDDFIDTFIEASYTYLGNEKPLFSLPVRLLNTCLTSAPSSLTTASYYTKQQTDSLFLTKGQYTDSTASIHAGRGVVITSLNTVNAVTQAQYSPGAIIFANTTSSLSMSGDMSYLPAEGLIVDNAFVSGLNATSLVAVTASITNLTVTGNLSASYAKTSSLCNKLFGPVMGVNGSTIATFDDSTPLTWGTASFRGTVKVMGDAQSTVGKPVVQFQSVITSDPSATLKLTGGNSSTVELVLSQNTGSAGTESVQRFRSEIPISSSLVIADTVKTTTIQAISGSLVTTPALAVGTNAYQAPGAILSTSGSILPTATNVFDLGATSNKWNNIYCNNLVGNITTAATSSYFSSSRFEMPTFVRGSKTVALNNTWVSGPSVTLTDNQSVYFRVSVHGNWTNVGPAGFTADGVITKGTSIDATSQPGMVFRSDNYNKDGRLIGVQIQDQSLVSGAATFPLQFSCSYSSIPSAVITYEIRGQFVSVQ